MPSGLCALGVVLFLLGCAACYIPGQGFTYFVKFGSNSATKAFPPLRAINHYELPDLAGYDGQYYAAIAMDPHPRDPALQAAVDDFPYRLRRILFCLLPYLAAGGSSLSLHFYAAENIVAWLALAMLLLRWLPPNTWGNSGRWLAVMFSLGLIGSVTHALLEGPSLLLIAIAVALEEAGKTRGACGVLALAGLGKETNLLALPALMRPGNKSKGRTLGLIAAAAIPLVLWIGYLHFVASPGGELGARNFSWPLAGYLGRWVEIIGTVRAGDWLHEGVGEALSQIALTVQCVVLLARPDWKSAWWRVGACYSVLMLCLGNAVWEGYPGAAPRVLLPMTAAFNILAPRRRGWWLIVLAGNLSVLAALQSFTPPGRDSVRIEGPRALRMAPGGYTVNVAFVETDWHPPEKSWLSYWRWSPGNGALEIQNPHPFAVVARVEFGLKSRDTREVWLNCGDQTAWRGSSGPVLESHTVNEVTLPSGASRWTFATDAPPFALPGESRGVTFSVRDLTVTLLRSAPVAASAETNGSPLH